ncbi:MAG: alkaline phosphatase family protein [Limnochordia bacterium]
MAVHEHALGGHALRHVQTSRSARQGIRVALGNNREAYQSPYALQKGTRALSATNVKHIVMLMLDAFRPDYLTIYTPPHLQRLVREGTWVAEARSVFPSTTTTNQTSFVTGALPASTGIPNNSRYDRADDCIRTKLRDNRCATIAEILGSHGWTAASVNHFMLQDRGVDRYISGGMEDVISLFAEERPPGLVVYYHSHTDTVGHAHGPFSPEMREAVMAIDHDIGRLLQLLDERDLARQTVIVVASDHGMIPNDGRPIEPELPEIFASLNLQVAASAEEIRPDTELITLQFGSTFLYWRNGKKHPERERQLLEALDQVQGLDYLLPEDIRRMGADPDRLADIVLVPQEGWMIRKGSGTGGLHGTPLAEHSTLLFCGAEVRKGAVIHHAAITDVVPTLLTLAGVPVPASVDGQVLTSVITTEAPTDYRAAMDAVLAEAAVSLEAEERQVEACRFAWEYLSRGSAAFTHDCGALLRVKAIGIVADAEPAPVGPHLYALEISADGVDFEAFHAGVLEPIADGQTVWIKKETPMAARFIRLTAYTGYAGDTATVRIARLLVTSDE